MNRTPTKPLQSLLDRLGIDREEAAEITSLSSHSIRKACYDKNPKGWQALILEVDRLHKINAKVLEAKIVILEDQLNKLS